MSNYESNPSGLGVGKSYGPREPGGVRGDLPNVGARKEVSIELQAGELTRPLTFIIPAYSSMEILENSFSTVTEVFAAGSSVDLSFDGGPSVQNLTLDSLGTEGFGGFTEIDGVANNTDIEVTVVPNATALASDDGKARINFRYFRQAN